MSIVNGIRTIDNLVAGNLSGAQLETWLGTGINKAGFIQAINSRSQVRLLTESLTALTAISTSPAAVSSIGRSSVSASIRDAIFANASTYSAMTASSTVMAAVAESALFMEKITESNTILASMFSLVVPKTAFYNSSIASSALFASTNAKAYMVAIATPNDTSSTTHASVNTGKTFLIQQKTINASFTSHAGANADTYSTNSTTYVDRFVKLVGLTHRISGADYGTVTYIDMD